MSEGGPIIRAEEVPSTHNPFIVTGAKCILCQSPVEVKLPVRLYLEKRMLGEVVMLCTNPECRAIGTAGFDIKRCDFIQSKKEPIPIED